MLNTSRYLQMKLKIIGNQKNEINFDSRWVNLKREIKEWLLNLKYLSSLHIFNKIMSYIKQISLNLSYLWGINLDGAPNRSHNSNWVKGLLFREFLDFKFFLVLHTSFVCKSSNL